MGSLRVEGSWQYEGLSSATNELSPPRPPSSPTLYSPNKNNSNSSVKLNGGDAFGSFVNSGIFTTQERSNNQNDLLLLSEGKGSYFIGNGATTLLSAVTSPIMAPIVNVQIPSCKQPSWMLDDMVEMSDLGGLSEQSFLLEGYDNLCDPIDESTTDSYLLQDYTTDTLTTTKAWSVDTAVNNESSIALSLDQHENFAVKEEETLEDDINLEDLGLSVEFSLEDLRQLQKEGIDLGLENIGENGMDVDEEVQDDDDEIESNSTIKTFNNNKKGKVEIVIIKTGEEEEEEDSQSSQFPFDTSFSATSSPSYEISQPSSVVSSDSDSEDETQEKTVDALLQRKFKAAAAMYPDSSPAVQEGKAYARILCSSRRGRPSRSAVEAATLMLPKPERRGRKPSSAAATGKSWVHVKDKTLRKKEQNKTAATRYRQKKKLETLEFLEQEKKLTMENDLLKKNQEDLKKEINVIKGLLRSLFLSKKQKRTEKKRR